jgi:hypothetical protein
MTTKLRLSATFFLAGAAAVYANSPLPDTTYTGIDKTIQVNTQSGFAAGGGGGEFLGTLTSNTSSPTTVSTYFWCVDDQEVFSFGQSALANVTLLGNVAANPTQVRYGNVTNSGTPNWTNNPTSTATIAAIGSTDASLLPTTAQDRYKMAAYLVSQYDGFNATVNNVDQNNAIQEAIWSITNNSGYAGGGIFDSGFSDMSGGSGSSTSSVAFWVDKALANYTTINPQTWAVVSWGATATGALDTGRYDSSSPARQTFLVELDGNPFITTTTPEPGFYGALAAGLGGLFFAARRKKNA